MKRIFYQKPFEFLKFYEHILSVVAGALHFNNVFTFLFIDFSLAFLFGVVNSGITRVDIPVEVFNNFNVGAFSEEGNTPGTAYANNQQQSTAKNSSKNNIELYVAGVRKGCAVHFDISIITWHNYEKPLQSKCFHSDALNSSTSHSMLHMRYHYTIY
uniref:Uncharacterized protein n=1 Tax=Glossina pallidipes TaxID=7398 RepID=A0A1A9ZJ79_GLOPL